ncbi:uncharacterized protein DUF4287 [Motilibacter rhizosphaerae]|uniref:Uncharacterized protein DUF4287 n=1 Tax=Motilibacter rhizosphaerae TaxID=598652 RepID=A0A4Q7NPT7_9ACTN|nr:DUF4287 domain-containing protein [Motilibacter rhizosphaerae]RZS87335.1 uncharacterized protein DUF4287 [Motilibacter rhizosphaerae]
MSHGHSDETHAQLISRIPTTTGREVGDWLQALEAGPSLLRFDERVEWLRTEHDLPHGYAAAIVHEHDLRRAHRSFS